MFRLASVAATGVLLLSANLSGVPHLRQFSMHYIEFPASANLLLFPDMRPAGGQLRSSQEQSAAAAKPPRTQNKDFAAASSNKRQIPLQPESILSLVRYVDGEFVHVLNPLPAGKDGFHLAAGEPVNRRQLTKALSGHGAAVNPGDTAQITNLEFKKHEIVVDVNGGARGRGGWRKRIHLEIGGLPTIRTTDQVSTGNANGGATLFLDFRGQVPDMTPDQLKQYLSGMLDFSKHHSASVQWIDTLPPDIRKAITEKRAAVGMNRDMVLAAMGRPDQKVRERTPEGIETEDWIYGHPPAKTVFVKFMGEKVVFVDQFPK